MQSSNRPDPAGPIGLSKAGRILRVAVFLEFTDAEIVKSFRETLRLVRRYEREPTSAPRRRGRPPVFSDPDYARVVRGEVQHVYDTIKPEWKAIQRHPKKADRVVALAGAIRRAWGHRSNAELAAEAIRDRLTPKQTAVLVVARIRQLAFETVKRNRGGK
jgi:hypothetical protein